MFGRATITLGIGPHSSASLLLPSVCARTDENVETVNDLVLSQKDKPQTYRDNHGRRVFIGRLYPRLFVKTCTLNVSRGAVHRS